MEIDNFINQHIFHPELHSSVSFVNEGGIYPLQSVDKTLGGCFDSCGNPIPLSFLVSYDKVNTSLLEIQDMHDVNLSYDDNIVIFGGYHNGHYGHFILETLSRLWISDYLDYPIVWLNSYPLIFDWQKIIIDIVGVKNRFLTFSKPTQFRTLIIPRPLLVLDSYITQDFLKFSAKYVKLSGSNSIGGRLVWISRSALSERCAQGELELESRLKNFGWVIFNPEKYSLFEQLEVFANAFCIAGIEGSAFHSLVLIKNLTCKVIILRRTKSRIYDLISKLMNLQHFNLYNLVDSIGSDIYDGKMYKINDVESTLNQIFVCANS
jgi:capsular polysaccharide biosynthesis protein